jgi:hypothetical protein
MEKTQEELISTLEKNKGYVKGYGQIYCRVMTHDHKPIYNVLKSTVVSLIENNVLYRDGLIIKLKER